MSEELLGTLYKGLLDLLLTVLVPALVVLAITGIKYLLAQSKLVKNELVQQLIALAVQSIEQSALAAKKSGASTWSSEEKRKQACDLAEKLLAERGITVELDSLATQVEAKVFSEVNKTLP